MFRKVFQKQHGYLVRAPGRVNILGGHVDYNDGPVLPVAIDLEVHLAAARSDDNVVHLYAYDLDEKVSFPLDSLEQRIDTQGKPLPDWALYPAGVAWSLKKAGYKVSGLQAVYNSDIPIGAGLGSSAAIEVGFAILWQAIGGWEEKRIKLAQLCLRAEIDYVGLNCGLMDQFASLCGVEGHALYLDTRNLDWSPVKLPSETVIVVADSGIRHTLTGSEYNQRVAACEKAVQLLRQHLPKIRNLRDVPATEFAAYSVFLPQEIRKRAEHVVKEIHRVNSAVNALRGEDAVILGALMYSSHASLRDLYQVSTPELDELVEIARNQAGCYGARLTGAGFGGCTVNLVDEKLAAKFAEGLGESYQDKTGRNVQIYVCEASAGASLKKM